jgi:transposase
MSKTDLQSRPIFHRKQEAIKAHILICFTSLIMEKFLELTTQMSIRNIRDFIWDITETHIQDTVTSDVFLFRSPTNDIMHTPLKKWILKWGLPH